MSRNAYAAQGGHTHQARRAKPGRRGLFGRIFRGYLMAAGLVFTLYWIIRGVALLDVWLASGRLPG